MPIIVPSSTQAVPGGTVFPPNVTATVALNTGDRIEQRWASAAADAGVTRTSFDVGVIDKLSGAALLSRDSLWTETNVVASWTADRPITVDLVLLGGGEPKDSSHGTVFQYVAEQFVAPVNYCQYGTELTAGASFVYYLTPGLIDTWLATIGEPWLAPLFTALWFTSFNAQELCGTGPPPLPTVDLSTLDASLATITQLLKCIAWPNVCRCKAGTPAPTPFPPPSIVEPPGWPTFPTFPCDPAMLCDAIQRIGTQLQGLQSSVGQLLELETIVQRYGLPFAYIRGRRFAGLSGAGTQGLSRCVGLLVEVLESPPNNRVKLGVPEYVYDLGWVSVLSADGLVDEMRLTRSATTWFSKVIPTAVTVGWALRDDVVIDISELLAEP